jgi:uncharacterized coiled-coil DUF342 family protein
MEINCVEKVYDVGPRLREFSQTLGLSIQLIEEIREKINTLKQIFVKDSQGIEEMMHKTREIKQGLLNIKQEFEKINKYKQQDVQFIKYAKFFSPGSIFEKKILSTYKLYADIVLGFSMLIMQKFNYQSYDEQTGDLLVEIFREIKNLLARIFEEIRRLIEIYEEIKKGSKTFVGNLEKLQYKCVETHQNPTEHLASEFRGKMNGQHTKNNHNTNKVDQLSKL